MILSRNAPCTCGSGKKYKRCPCGAYEATQFPRAKRREAEQVERAARYAAMSEERRLARRRRAQGVTLMLTVLMR